MVRKVIYLTIIFVCTFFLTVKSGAPPGINRSAICEGSEANSRCALLCIMYPVFTGGICDKNNECQCQKSAAGSPPPKEVANGPCPHGGDPSCSVSCLFYSQFNNGYCTKGLCMCVTK